MALSNYSELQTAVANELHAGSKLDSLIPDFIARAEAKINRRLYLREMEHLAYYSYDETATERYLALPNRFLELIALAIKPTAYDDSYYAMLRYVAPADIADYYRNNRQQPSVFTLRNYLELDALPERAYTLRMHYLKGWDIANETTNWLLTNFPDIYLYGAVLEATAHVQDDQRLAIWKTAFDEAIEEANAHAERSRNDTTLSTNELARMNRPGIYNIRNG